MDSESRVYVAGNTGLVGSAIVRMLHRKDTRTFFQLHLPTGIFVGKRMLVDSFKSINQNMSILLLQRVGGIGANRDYPAHFIYDNLMIQIEYHQCV